MNEIYYLNSPQFIGSIPIRREISPTDAARVISLSEVVARQAPTYDGWICPDCKHHGGGLNCKKNVFISVVGANMKGCIFFKE
jgi:hypothetical protein